VIALVGYTNAGKSAILKAVTQAADDVVDAPISEDRLFHTLDTAARGVRLPTGAEAVLLDTVGFISELPHQLVAAFRETLAEVLDATVIVHVRDASHPESEFQKTEVLRVLRDELGATPEQLDAIIEVHNKVDLLPPGEARRPELAAGLPTCAPTGEGLDQLLAVVAARVAVLAGELTKEITVPMAAAHQINFLHKHAVVLGVQADPTGEALTLACRIKPAALRRFEALVHRGG